MESSLDKSKKIEISYNLQTVLFASEKARLKKLMDGIQDKHHLVHGSRGFILNGSPIYNGDAIAARDKFKKNLHPDLVNEASFIVKSLKKLDIDALKIANFTSTLDPHCHSYADYRDVLPDVVVHHMTLHEITGLPRTREAGYIFASSPIKMKQFGNMCALMDHYLIQRMLF